MTGRAWRNAIGPYARLIESDDYFRRCALSAHESAESMQKFCDGKARHRGREGDYSWREPLQLRRVALANLIGTRLRRKCFDAHRLRRDASPTVQAGFTG